MPVLRLAIASPLRQYFDYLPPPGLDSEAIDRLAPGCRLLVPFGRRLVCGILVEKAAEAAIAREKLRAAQSVLDVEPLISGDVLKLCFWAADYYAHPPGEVLAAALTAQLRKGGVWRPASDSVWQLTLQGRGLPEGALTRAPRQSALLLDLQQHGELSSDSLRERGHSRESVRALKDKGLIECVELPLSPSKPRWREGPPLSDEQAAVMQALDAKPAGFNVWLLQGITGSGKTEIYFRLIARTLKEGEQALLLVPEISLTPQLVSRVQSRFDAVIATLHSGMTETARQRAWEAARSGLAHIVIGTRSAIFTSLARPGLILVDEEHDQSFKQQDGFRYSARDLAVKRAQLDNIPVVLGSATPSLESLQNANSGRYRRLRLRERIGSSRLPSITILDIRREVLRSGLTDRLMDAIDSELEQGNQVLLFLNRRGYAPTLQCHDCGYIADCRHCDARLTLHRSAGELRCHHCEWRMSIPASCPQCKSRQLNAQGVGTERIEAELKRAFPDYPVHRVDRDSMQRGKAMEELIAAVRPGDPCILLGTQMLTKGHHFPDVTLVALLDTDAALFSADFRGPERMGQLLTQVAGRAGRAAKAGRVIVQTHYPDHPLLNTLLESGYDEFAERLLEDRQRSGLPPFGHMAMARAEAAEAERAETFLAGLRLALERERCPVQLIGPLPSPLQRKAGRFRYQLMILASSRAVLKHAAVALADAAGTLPESRRLRWSLDIDPIEA